MKRYPFIILAICILHISGSACTTFFIHHNGQMVFGRNYDWVADAGFICTNQRGASKTSYKNNDGKTITWVSKYGSLTFNQYGKEFPMGGMNEKGLVVEIMWLDDTKYPVKDDRASIEDLQWVQYQLDNCSTIEEVIATDKIIRIASHSTPLHYLVADAKGNAATIEFLDGKMVAHYGNTLPQPVLTNDTYDKSIAAYRNKLNRGNNSLDRFNKACDMVAKYKAGSSTVAVVDYAFSILGAVAQGDFTKWQIVYDITNKKIYFRTEQSGEMKSVNYASFDLECGTPSKALNINTLTSGDVTTEFANLTQEMNRATLKRSVEQSRDRITVDLDQVEAVLRYPGEITCF